MLTMPVFDQKQLLSYPFYVFYASLCILCLSYWQAKTNSPASLSEVGEYQCLPVRIIDGDSVIVNCNDEQISVRLIHIDAPEMRQQPWGKAAKNYLRQQLRDKSLLIQLSGKDIYQRYLGQIFIGETDINLLLVSLGYARVYQRYKPPKHYLQAMQKAKLQQLGIWRVGGLQQDPQRWRRLDN